MTLSTTDSRLPSGTFTLIAADGPVTFYFLTVASSADGALTASPSSGSLTEGQSVTITLTLATLTTLDTQIVINPGDVVVDVQYTAPVANVASYRRAISW